MQHLEARLRREVEGAVLFDAFSRGRYATDASIYQIDPIGVFIPRDGQDALRGLEIAADSRVPILPRGAGTSQCGQTVGDALVIDNSRHLTRILDFDPEAATVWVEPGIVLDQLNAWLKPHGLWYPVDVSTSAQATIGGMTANNSCGARSIRYGNMVHNVLGAQVWLSSGETVALGDTEEEAGTGRAAELAGVVRALHARERDEIARRVPGVQRRVAGYNLDLAAAGPFNMAHLVVGSEGTLGYFRQIKLKLSPLPEHKVLGVVHFATFHAAMSMTQHIVKLHPDAVELVDRTMIDLSRGIAAFRDTVDTVVRGEPAAILLVEFAGDNRDDLLHRLAALNELMADLGLPGSVVDIVDAGMQRNVWGVRKAGLNIMMSMKGDGKPVSFIEDCAVPLEHLADYTARLTEVFEKHGTQGTWYAHASVGCLHVRPVLDMRSGRGLEQMREIAEEACALVRRYKGSYSGEHGDGLVRSEWIERVYGPRLARAFAELKNAFDPLGLMNPGKIVSPVKMDDPSLLRYKPGYVTAPIRTALDWSTHEVGPHNEGRGFAAAIEMCNNNGHCRKFDAGTMCPSFRVTGNERDLTRGRANSLRLAISGQLGPDGLTSREMYRTLELCVSCKGCRRECPTGVDMARMKIEFLHQYHLRHPRPLRDRLVASVPRYARYASMLAPLLNLRDRVPGAALLTEKLAGFSARRRLPRWRRDFFRGASEVPRVPGGAEVVLLSDTFNTWFEPENLRAAVKVLSAAGRQVRIAEPGDRGRPLCCGRTYLATGMVEAARAEARRLLEALGPFVDRGLPVVGLEPSCLFGLKDEFGSLLPGPETEALGEVAMTFEDFVLREHDAGRWGLDFNAVGARQAYVHGHCHQKAFGAMPALVKTLRLIPELDVQTIESSCCGMAGAFGYHPEHIDVSLAMAEASLLPAVRAAAESALIVADGTSCRHQIEEGAGRKAVHSAQVLAMAAGASG
jgi:FAD/FMN-containing dehydrogenase/Fe-S oxidoreductase